MPRKPTHTLIIIPPGTEPLRAIFTHPTLSALQEAVGGYIEAIPGLKTLHGRRCQAFAHEEGLLRRLPYNPRAAILWRKQYGYATGLVGPVVIQVKGDVASEYNGTMRSPLP